MGAAKELMESLLLIETVPGPQQAQARVYNGAVCAPSVTLEQSWAGWHLGSGQEFISLERASHPSQAAQPVQGWASAIYSPPGLERALWNGDSGVYPLAGLLTCEGFGAHYVIWGWSLFHGQR